MLLSITIWRNYFKATLQVINNFKQEQWEHPIFQASKWSTAKLFHSITRSSTFSTNNGYSLTANSESSAAHRFSLYFIMALCVRMCVRLCSLCLYLYVSPNLSKTLISPYGRQKALKGDKDGVMNGCCPQGGCLLSRLSLMRSKRRHWITDHLSSVCLRLQLPTKFCRYNVNSYSHISYMICVHKVYTCIYIKRKATRHTNAHTNK